jgi:hypothetical protein
MGRLGSRYILVLGFKRGDERLEISDEFHG